MLSDDDLTLALRDSFDEATAALRPSGSLATRVRRERASAQRRRAALGIGVPVAAATSIGLAVHSASRPAPAAVRHGVFPANEPIPGNAAPASTALAPVAATSASTASGTARLLTYRIAQPAGFTTPGCLVTTVERKGADWLLVGRSGCIKAIIGYVPDKPADAQPYPLAGVEGLFATSDAKTRTVYARADADTKADTGDDWSVLRVPLATSEAEIAAFFTPEP